VVLVLFSPGPIAVRNLHLSARFLRGYLPRVSQQSTALPRGHFEPDVGTLILVHSIARKVPNVGWFRISCSVRLPYSRSRHRVSAPEFQVAAAMINFGKVIGGTRNHTQFKESEALDALFHQTLAIWQAEYFDDLLFIQFGYCEQLVAKLLQRAASVL
jgi:hypothetical protein